MIKFQKYYVTDGVTKARVNYSSGPVWVTREGNREMLSCITLYAQDYSRSLAKVLPDGYQNDTDSMTDYFDQGRVRIFPGDPLYAAALARCEANDADRNARWAKRMQKYAPGCVAQGVAA